MFIKVKQIPCDIVFILLHLYCHKYQSFNSKNDKRIVNLKKANKRIAIVLYVIVWLLIVWLGIS